MLKVVFARISEDEERFLMVKSVEAMRKRSREIDKNLGQYAEAFSRILWPWRERWLLLITGSCSLLDYVSTFAALKMNGEHNVYESGHLASCALAAGGFPFLIVVDLTTAALLSLIALSVQRLYAKFGFKNYGRAAFIFFLTPYVLITGFAIVNNLVLAFR